MSSVITNSQAVFTVSLVKLPNLSSLPHILKKKRVGLSIGSPRFCIFLTISLHAMHGLGADYNMPHAALNTSHTLPCIFTPHNNPELYALIYYYFIIYFYHHQDCVYQTVSSTRVGTLLCFVHYPVFIKVHEK